MKKTIKNKLVELETLLINGGESSFAKLINKSLRGNDDNIWKLLTSNELWGGSGSIADQALIENDALRNQLQNILIELGNLQLNENRVNTRTEIWVSAFSQRKN